MMTIVQGVEDDAMIKRDDTMEPAWKALARACVRVRTHHARAVARMHNSTHAHTMTRTHDSTHAR